MALHDLVYDCSTKTVKKVQMTAEEEAAQLALWAAEDKRVSDLPPVISTEERITALEQNLAQMRGGA